MTTNVWISAQNLRVILIVTSYLFSFFSFVNLPKVDEVHHGRQGGVGEAPHEDQRLGVGKLKQ